MHLRYVFLLSFLWPQVQVDKIIGCQSAKFGSKDPRNIFLAKTVRSGYKILLHMYIFIWRSCTHTFQLPLEYGICPWNLLYYTLYLYNPIMHVSNSIEFLKQRVDPVEFNNCISLLATVWFNEAVVQFNEAQNNSMIAEVNSMTQIWIQPNPSTSLMFANIDFGE